MKNNQKAHVSDLVLIGGIFMSVLKIVLLLLIIAKEQYRKEQYRTNEVRGLVQHFDHKKNCGGSWYEDVDFNGNVIRRYCFHGE